MALSKIKSDSIDTIASTKLTGTVSDAQIAAMAASKLTGTIADARFPATLPAASGANLTALNGSNVASGTVADARISTLTSSKLSGALPAVSGASLTNLDARDLENALPAIDGSSLTGVGVAGITSSADATAITIDSSERVGVGTGSPAQLLHIAGSSPTIRVDSSTTSDDP